MLKLLKNKTIGIDLTSLYNTEKKNINLIVNMSKPKGNKKGNTVANTTEIKKEVSQKCPPHETVIIQDKSKNILINIVAKPGAKQNAITDICTEGVCVQINAPPMDGEANSELVKFISSVVGVRKGNVSLEKGFKSRQKTVKILGDNVSLEEVKSKILGEFK